MRLYFRSGLAISLQEQNGLAGYKIEDTIFHKFIEKYHEWIRTTSEDEEAKSDLIDINKILIGNQEEITKCCAISIIHNQFIWRKEKN